MSASEANWPEQLPAAYPSPASIGQTASVQRWSADGWFLLRDGGRNGPLAGGTRPATYGASQTGAVLRYRLSLESVHRPAAYVRATAALNGSGEKEAALGISARPLPRVNVVVAVEGRVFDGASGAHVRPAAMVVTEIPPIELPGKLRGEVYGQAGYVGGRDATAFADGQLRADRTVMQARQVEVRAGAGAWAGMQEGAERLDVGPSVSARIGLGTSGSARISADWRLRVAGDATPTSGPALTLSAGF